MYSFSLVVIFLFSNPHLWGSIPLIFIFSKIVERILCWIKNIFHNKSNKGLLLEHETYAMGLQSLVRRLHKTGQISGVLRALRHAVQSLQSICKCDQVEYIFTCDYISKCVLKSCIFLSERWFLLKKKVTEFVQCGFPDREKNMFISSKC